MGLGVGVWGVVCEGRHEGLCAMAGAGRGIRDVCAGVGVAAVWWVGLCGGLFGLV